MVFVTLADVPDGFDCCSSSRVMVCGREAQRAGFGAGRRSRLKLQLFPPRALAGGTPKDIRVLCVRRDSPAALGEYISAAMAVCLGFP